MGFINSTSKWNVAIWAFMLILSVPCAVQAKSGRVKTVAAKYEFVAGDSYSPAEAKRIALERAQIQAIADEFGTMVSQSTVSSAANTQSGGQAQSSIKVISLGASDVRGEWIRTIGEPEYRQTYDPRLGLVINVTVKGEIRERVAAEIDYKSLILRNGYSEDDQSSSFNDGDDLYLLFQSPVNGNLAVYLADTENAYCLLPYRNQEDGAMPILKNREYIFFSIEQSDDNMRRVVDEYSLTCGVEMELNRIYIVFSPNEFVKAVDGSGDGVLPRNLSFKDFQKWLGKARSQDERMSCRAIDISINPKN